MKKFLLAGVALSAIGLSNAAQAADPGKGACPYGGDPYKNYNCLDAYLGTDFLSRFINYYRLEWGHDAAPADPKAPASRRPEWVPTPESTPPMPFAEWPYGGTTNLGVTRANSIDSPLMAAMSNTAIGQWLSDAHIQVYGWIDPGGNLSTNTVRGGNAPAAYSYNPNTVQLDQAVLYIERLPDTVQTDHIDWGFRIAAMYGENYRYTTAYGLASHQLLGHNLYNGYDFPMVYGELYIPKIAEGLLLRVGRFISLPDIEAQLAPNNYMYSHSMAYSYDNYTNTGIQATLAVTKNLFLQLGLSVGTEAMPWHLNARIPNPLPNPLFPETTFKKDPGAMPSITGCLRYQTDSGRDNVYLCADAINSGTWGYNNLQWYGGTYYHKFNDKWHVSFEGYTLFQKNVPNVTDPLGIIAAGGTPFLTPGSGILFNAPNFAFCKDPNVLSCTAQVYALLMYLNYKATPLDNITLRTEFYNDIHGQRTSVPTRYWDVALGWQHWWSPQIEMRPELAFYRAVDKPAFNGNFNVSPLGANAIAPTKQNAVIFACDFIIHF